MSSQSKKIAGFYELELIRTRANILPIECDSLTVTTWHAAVGVWITSLRSAGVSNGTTSLRRYQLARLADSFASISPYDLTERQLSDWLGSQTTWSKATLRSYRSAVRSFFDHHHQAGNIDRNPSARLRRVHVPRPQPRPAAEPVIDAALSNTIGRREWLMLMLGSRHGLRRCEISRVHTNDLVEASDGWPELVVHGKGDKDRRVPLLPGVAAVIEASTAGWLFPSRNPEQHLTAAHVGVLLRRVLVGATPHQLRHRCASRAYQATHDIRAVQELLGHASVATTQIYTAVANDAVRRAVESAA